jgi:putative membrane protein
MYYYYPMMNGQDWSSGIFIMLFWVLVLALIGFIVIRLFKNHEPTDNTRIDPISIVKERYAKGEITKEEFEQLKKDLK